MLADFDPDTVLVIPDFMSTTSLGAGPYSSSHMMREGENVPLFGCTFVYIDDDTGNLKRSYALIPTDYKSKISYVSIQYMKNFFAF